MPILPPDEGLLSRASLPLMEVYGRMRSLVDAGGFESVLPIVWQCSDESQGIKKALFGYVFDCPVFNLGRVGGLLDPTRLIPAANHGQDLVILGGSHIGAVERDGVGYLERIHGEKAPCCGMLHRTLRPYLDLYRRAATLITVQRQAGRFLVEIPYKYLFQKPAGEVPRIQLLLHELTEGEALFDGSRGKVYALHPRLVGRHEQSLASIDAAPVSVADILDHDCFVFSRTLDHAAMDPRSLLEVSIFDFLPDIVTARFPHRRLADVNTWRQFHRLVSYLTDAFDGSDRNILVIAGLTLDHTIRHNTFIPQFGYWMEKGRALQARYFSPDEVEALLLSQPAYHPNYTFMEYAGAR